MTEKEQQLVYELNSTEADRILWKTTAIKQGNAIAELKAQVNCLREALLNTIMYRVGTVNYGDPLEALESTPEQCLAEVKAKAIEDAAKKCGVKNIDGTYCWVDSLQDVAKQLREQAK